MHGHTAETQGVNATDNEQDSCCPLCEEQGHSPTACNRFKTISERFDIVKRKRLCFSCLVNKKKHGRCTVRHQPRATCTRGCHHAALCRTFAMQQQRKMQVSSRYGTRIARFCLRAITLISTSLPLAVVTAATIPAIWRSHSDSLEQPVPCSTSEPMEKSS